MRIIQLIGVIDRYSYIIGTLNNLNPPTGAAALSYWYFFVSRQFNLRIDLVALILLLPVSSPFIFLFEDGLWKLTHRRAVDNLVSLKPCARMILIQIRWPSRNN